MGFFKDNICKSTLLAIISITGMMEWLITEFYGGMFIHFASFPIFYFIIICLFIFSFFETIKSMTKRGWEGNIIKISLHIVFILFVVGISICQSETFKSKRILTATLYDDLFNYTLILREDGKCETDINGMIGYNKTFRGNYLLKGDTIVFTKIPYDSDKFIPETMLIDKSRNAIFHNRSTDGSFIKKNESLNYFKIHESSNK